MGRNTNMLKWRALLSFCSRLVRVSWLPRVWDLIFAVAAVVDIVTAAVTTAAVTAAVTAAAATATAAVTAAAAASATAVTNDSSTAPHYALMTYKS